MLKKFFSRSNKDSKISSDDQPGESRLPLSSNEDLGTRLRAEMLPASHVTPHMPAYPRQLVTPGRVGAVLILLGLLGLGWFFGIGPGRPFLEDALVSLAQRASTPTPTLAPTETPVPPTATATIPPTATPRSTRTPTPSLPSETPTVTPTETAASGCRDFSTVTLADVGLELCVQGTVLRVIEYPTNTLIVFSDELGALYLVTYDVVWPDDTIGTCYQITGEVEQLLNSPVILFGYYNQPVVCP